MNVQEIIPKLLSTITMPSSGKTLNSMAIKPIVSIEDQTLNIELKSGFPHLYLKNEVASVLDAELKKNLPNFHIKLSFSSGIRSHQTQMPGQSLKQVKNVIAVASGKGGVGKSTVCINLAVALAKAGAKVGILDADIYGPSIPIMLGQPNTVEVQHDKYIPILTHGVQAMSIGYLTKNEPALIWRGPMLAKSMIQMLDITQWNDLDYLFIDLPPGTGDIQLSLVQKIPLSGAVVVSTPQSVATLDADKAIKMFNKTNINVLGVIENMSTHVCSNCNHEEPIFGSGGGKEIAQLHNLPLLGQLPLNLEIVKDCDNGTPTAGRDDALAKPFDSSAFNLSYLLSERPLNYADKLPPVSTIE